MLSTLLYSLRYFTITYQFSYFRFLDLLCYFTSQFLTFLYCFICLCSTTSFYFTLLYFTSFFSSTFFLLHFSLKSALLYFLLYITFIANSALLFLLYCTLYTTLTIMAPDGGALRGRCRSATEGTFLQPGKLAEVIGDLS